MNNFAVNNLANMEQWLYGYKAGSRMDCPSVYNGYYTNSVFNNGLGNYGIYGNYVNPSFYGYNNTGFGQSIPSNYTQKAESQSQSQSTSFQQGITQDDMDKLADYYAKNNALEEGFMGAAAGGLSWMAFEHLQSVIHPKNAWKGIKEAKEIFKVIPKEWAGKNAALLQDAQIAVQQAVRDTGTKGWWSKWLRKPIDKTAIDPLLKEMKTAIASKDVNKIAMATERLKAARGMDGRIARIFSKGRTVAQRLSDKTKSGAIKKDAENLIKINEGVITKNFGSLAKSFLKKDFIGFMLFETVFNAGKIITAFQKDTKTGVEQTCQSLGKSALGTAGWCLGRAGGALLGAKVGASLGIAGGPAGAAVGALIGFTVGSIGMWAGHKLGNMILGHDIADKVEAKNMTKTQEGQTELLQFAMQKAQEGKTDPNTSRIVYKALNTYA